jgi:hypothetical protein
LRRKPARIGEAQGGSNCSFSVSSGLPALAVPAGFTSDELPVGMDLLGGSFSEADLLSLGYGIEQTLKLRRPPFSTPALVAGKRPAAKTTTAAYSGASINLSYDQTTSRMHYTLTVAPAAADRLAAVWIHAGTVEKPGAARHQLFGAGQPPTGFITLSAGDRTDLTNGRLLVRFYQRDGRGSSADVPVSFRLGTQ